MKISGKRGEISGEIIMMIPKILFLTAVLFAVVILVKLYIITNTDIREVESNVLIGRLLYSKHGLSYFDEDLKRVYPGAIDLNKFKQIGEANPNGLDMISLSYGSDNPIISAKITLKQESKDDVIAFYNKNKFDQWEPRTLSTVKGGAGSVKSFRKEVYVLVNDNGKFSPAILEFNIIS